MLHVNLENLISEEEGLSSDHQYACTQTHTHSFSLPKYPQVIDLMNEFKAQAVYVATGEETWSATSNKHN